jgi:transcriptional regulator with XRE-family HTH domain
MQANEIPKMIFKRRIVLNMSNEDLARETGIQPFWWEKVQRDASGLLAAATFTPILFFRNAVTLQAGWEISEIGIPSLRADNKLEQTEKVSLDNLYEAYVCREDLVDDEVLLSLWEEYHQQDGQNGDTLWKNGKVVSKEEWLVRIKEIETTIHERCEKNRIIRLLQFDLKILPDIHRTSLGNLYVFLGEVNRISDENLLRLCKHFKKDIAKSIAARDGDESNLRPYSVKDWRHLFKQQQHLND